MEPVDKLNVTIHTVCIDGQIFVDFPAYESVDYNVESTDDLDSVLLYSPRTPQSISSAAPSPIGNERVEVTAEQPSIAISKREEPEVDVAEYASEEVAVTLPRYCSSSEIERCSADILAIALEKQCEGHMQGRPILGTKDIHSILTDPHAMSFVEECVLVDSSTIPLSQSEDHVSVDHLLNDEDCAKKSNEQSILESVYKTFEMDLTDESDDDDVILLEEEMINEVTLPLDISEPPTPSGRSLIKLEPIDESEIMETEIVDNCSLKTVDYNVQASSMSVVDFYPSTVLCAYGYDPNMEVHLGE